MRIEATNPTPPATPPSRSSAGEEGVSFISLVNQFLATQADPATEGCAPLWNTQVLEEILREEAALEEARPETEEEKEETRDESYEDEKEMAAGDYQPDQETASFEAGTGEEAAEQGAPEAEIELEFNQDIPFDPSSLHAWIHSEKFQEMALGNNQEEQTWRQLIEAAERQPLEEADIGFLIPLLLQQYPSLTSESYFLLEELLSALLAGQSRPIDQHLMVHLDATGWEVVFTIIPPHFFKGLLAPLADGQEDSSLPDPSTCRRLFEAVVFQRGLVPSDIASLQSLYAASAARFSTSTLPEWLSQGHFNPSLNIRFLLETLQQSNLLLPGPVGQLQSLALRYVHRKTAMQGFFQLSQQYLHGLPLKAQETRFLAQALFEHCFHPDLAAREEILPLLEQLLAGQPLLRPRRIRLLQAGSQVLRYLPFHQVHAQWQALLEFIYTHPSHIEDPGLGYLA